MNSAATCHLGCVGACPAVVVVVVVVPIFLGSRRVVIACAYPIMCDPGSSRASVITVAVVPV